MSIKISEKHLEDLLYEAIQTEGGCNELYERGLPIFYDDNCIYYRQLNLNEYGIPDIVRLSFCPYKIIIEIIELKVTDFDVAHLLQLGRYLSAAHHIISKAKIKQQRFDIRGMLIVAGFDSRNDYTWLDKTLNNSISIYSTDYHINGMHFKKRLPQDWIMSNAKTNLPDLIDMEYAIDTFKNAYDFYFISNGHKQDAEGKNRSGAHSELMEDLPFPDVNTN